MAIGGRTYATAFTGRSSLKKEWYGLTLRNPLNHMMGRDMIKNHDAYYSLRIDEEFQSLVPPISANEQKRLEENLVRDGCLDPLCVWDETMLDGRHRYDICIRHGIPFSIAYVFLHSREEAFAWICARQLLRTDIPEGARRYLIGKRYELENRLRHHYAAKPTLYAKKNVIPVIASNVLPDKTAHDTGDRLGRECNLTCSSVANYAFCARTLDRFAATTPELMPKILSGHFTVSFKKLTELSRRSAPDVQNEIAQWKEANTKPSILSPPKESVKNMPTYDPDAEIHSLALTIPSWVSTMRRICGMTNFTEISESAQKGLEERLNSLISIVNTMISTIKEKHP